MGACLLTGPISLRRLECSNSSFAFARRQNWFKLPNLTVTAPSGCSQASGSPAPRRGACVRCPLPGARPVRSAWACRVPFGRADQWASKMPPARARSCGAAARAPRPHHRDHAPSHCAMNCAMYTAARRPALDPCGNSRVTDLLIGHRGNIAPCACTCTPGISTTARDRDHTVRYCSRLRLGPFVCGPCKALSESPSLERTCRVPYSCDTGLTSGWVHAFD